jgi:hypothetical protein
LKKNKTQQTMKKSLLLLSVFIGMAVGAFAQLCVVDTAGFTYHQYVYPDSLPTIVAGQAYSQVVSIEIPDTIDANYFISAIPSGTASAIIDSVKIDSIVAAPTGITSVSNPVLGTWLKPYQYACATFSGTTTDTTGTYALKVYGTGCGHFTLPALLGGGTYDSCLAGFNLARVFPLQLKVLDTLTNGIAQIADGVNLNIYPNPNQGNFTVTVSSSSRLTGNLSVVDQLGRMINTQTIDVTGTKQIPLTLGDVAPGAYLLLINAEGQRSVKQFIVR